LDAFGAEVAVYGDTVAVGAPQHRRDAASSDSIGAVYIYSRKNWPQPQILLPSGNEVDSYFGYRLAMEGNMLAVSAFESGGSGVVYIFSRWPAAQWQQVAVLHPSDSRSNYFGESLVLFHELQPLVAVEDLPHHTNNTTTPSPPPFSRCGELQQMMTAVVVGAPGDDSFGELAGAVYLFATEPYAFAAECAVDGSPVPSISFDHSSGAKITSSDIESFTAFGDSLAKGLLLPCE
jgi:hypothetical protein